MVFLFERERFEVEVSRREEYADDVYDEHREKDDHRQPWHEMQPVFKIETVKHS
jgi:hypothetical protein